MDIDLPYHQPFIEDDEINEVVETLKSGWLTTGPRTFQFEEDFRKYTESTHAIGLNSCTAGLHLAISANDFPAGDEVITTTMTFPATANAIIHAGLRPVFVDIEPGTLNIDVNQIEEKITPLTRAIVPVHFAGHPCDMDAIMELAQKHKLKVIEDAAHALESKYKNRKIGSLGNPTSFSFYANKNITTGEGGMLTLNDDSLADKIRIMRLHGISRDAWKRYGKNGFKHWELDFPGYKYNMSDINAAIGIHQLKKVDRFFQLRKHYASLYDLAFDKISEVNVLETKKYAKTSHHLYIISLQLEQLKVTRDEFIDAIQSKGIGVAVNYKALHLQPYYQKKYKVMQSNFPTATRYSESIISLPLYPRMTIKNVERVIEIVSDLIMHYRR